jgi:putative transposase
MQVARSGYHAWAVREECDRIREDRVLSVHVAAAFERSRRTYGSPRIQATLREGGLRIGRGRAARIMREIGLVARRKKAFRTTPAPCPSERVSPNRLDRKFVARAPNRKWVTDVKYVRTSAGWLCLAPLLLAGAVLPVRGVHESGGGPIRVRRPFLGVLRQIIRLR